MRSKLPLLPSGPGGVRKSTFHGPWRGKMCRRPDRTARIKTANARASSCQRRGANQPVASEPKATAAPGLAEESLRVLQGRSQSGVKILSHETSAGVWLAFDSSFLPPLLQSGFGVLVGFPGRRPPSLHSRRTCPGLANSAPLARKHRDPLALGKHHSFPGTISCSPSTQRGGKIVWCHCPRRWRPRWLGRSTPQAAEIRVASQARR